MDEIQAYASKASDLAMSMAANISDLAASWWPTIKNSPIVQIVSGAPQTNTMVIEKMLIQILILLIEISIKNSLV